MGLVLNTKMCKQFACKRLNTFYLRKNNIVLLLVQRIIVADGLKCLSNYVRSLHKRARVVCLTQYSIYIYMFQKPSEKHRQPKKTTVKCFKFGYKTLFEILQKPLGVTLIYETPRGSFK